MRFLYSVIFIFFSFVSLNGDEFREVRDIALKKEQNKKILVKYDDRKKVFKFRWTLFKNETLVVFHFYGKKVAQTTLRLNHKNQSFRVYLMASGADYLNVPYFLIKFKKFDFKKQKAIFRLLLSDKDMQVRLKDLN